jgi:hypothetical protein
MGVLLQLVVTDPVMVLNAPAVEHQLQQGLWGGSQAGKTQTVDCARCRQRRRASI